MLLQTMETNRRSMAYHFKKPWLISIICLGVVLVISGEFAAVKAKEDVEVTENTNTDLIKDPEDPLILLSTLDGCVYGVGQKTGHIRWKLKDEPVVKVPLDTAKAIVPLFLPDPKDGSLYLLGGSGREALKKLQYTIPELVAASPCRSSDGILYTGKKMDTWFSVDPKTGVKEQILSVDKIDKTCPIANADAIFIGRTEYNVMMFDSKTKQRKWNITFFDYSSTNMEGEKLNNYDVVHFAASSTGRAVTLDRRLGNLLWERDYGSPVIAVYSLEADGLLSVPFTSVADETLDHLLARYDTAAEHSVGPADVKLYPTLYIGEHPHGLYALPSLVDETTVTISPVPRGPPQIEGPTSGPAEANADEPGERVRYESWPLPGQNVKMLPHQVVVDLPPTYQSLPRDEDGKHQQPIIILGHYKMSDQSAFPRIAGRSDPVIPVPPNFVLVDRNRSNSDESQAQQNPEFVGLLPNLRGHSTVGVQTEPTNETAQENTTDGWETLSNGNISFILSRDFVIFAYNSGKYWLNKQENKFLKVTVVALIAFIFAMLWYLYMQVREFRQLSQGSKDSSSGSRNGTITAFAEEMGGGVVKVGKIKFNMDEVLGKGCEGTFVYKGEFDNRPVAVKRLLPECFTFADREVDLLRESDEHQNVIRYFCTEQDKQFRYIALELCAATLHDYIEGRYSCDDIGTSDILYQSTAGLAHLHSLDIVHRDIKPHNVLISLVNQRGEVRVMISDFGLCKKLQLGRMSFSRRSGITGTDGWIAPEMLNGSGRTTCAVDIFSLGCVFYYVLTGGKHPFGDALRRQGNILSGEPKLNEMCGGEFVVPRSLIESMISPEPLKRPPASAVQKHPLFWTKAKILTFLQDVSDRVEKDDLLSSPVLQALEAERQVVIGDDWRLCIDPEVADDLRKFRNYRGDSVRDLLRALRNKKHHYRELSTEVQRSLGEIPDKFVDYWTQRFPNLLLHSWLKMQCVKAEPIFAQHYPGVYLFPNNLNLSEFKSDFMPIKNGSIVGSWMETLRRKSPEKPAHKSRNGGQFWTTANASSQGNWRRGSPEPDRLFNDRKEVKRGEQNDKQLDGLKTRLSPSKDDTPRLGNYYRESSPWRESKKTDVEKSPRNGRLVQEIGQEKDIEGFPDNLAVAGQDECSVKGVTENIPNGSQGHERRNVRKRISKGKKMQPKQPKEKSVELPPTWSLPPP